MRIENSLLEVHNQELILIHRRYLLTRTRVECLTAEHTFVKELAQLKWLPKLLCKRSPKPFYKLV